jgi:hypothetical protein
MSIIADLQEQGKLQVAVEEQGIQEKNLFYEKYDMAVRFGAQRGGMSSPVTSSATTAATDLAVMVASCRLMSFFYGASVSIDIRPAYGTGLQHSVSSCGRRDLSGRYMESISNTQREYVSWIVPSGVWSNGKGQAHKILILI